MFSHMEVVVVMPETRCPNCRATVYHDKNTWCKCDQCEERVYFDPKLREKFGSSVPLQFQPDPWDRSSNSDDETDEDDSRQASLTDY